MNTLVIGLGNPILGDDGAGWRVVEKVQQQIDAASSEARAGAVGGVDFDYCTLGGLSLMERLIGYDQAILVDAVVTGGQPGAVTCIRLDDLPDYSTAHTTAVHDTSLQNALRVGRVMGAHLPETVWVVGIEAKSVYTFSEELTPVVAAAIPPAARSVLNLIRQISLEEVSP
ncbi:MAG TPA: hydrogenase maturation protease [Anaerolineales bacterium]|nr:hydrogenase maturation protease [Anaerolineales bacterium]